MIKANYIVKNITVIKFYRTTIDKTNLCQNNKGIHVNFIA